MLFSIAFGRGYNGTTTRRKRQHGERECVLRTLPFFVLAIKLTPFPFAATTETRSSRISAQEGGFFSFLCYVEKGHEENGDNRKRNVSYAHPPRRFCCCPCSLPPPRRELAVPSPLFAKAFFTFHPCIWKELQRRKGCPQRNDKEKFVNLFSITIFAVPLHPAPLSALLRRDSPLLSRRSREKSLNQRGMRFLARPSPGAPEKPIVSPSFRPGRAFSAGSAR